MVTLSRPASSSSSIRRQSPDGSFDDDMASEFPYSPNAELLVGQPNGGDSPLSENDPDAVEEGSGDEAETADAVRPRKQSKIASNVSSKVTSLPRPSDMTIIQPWRDVQAKIDAIIVAKTTIINIEGQPTTTQLAVLPITIPHGIQLLRTLPHSRPTLKSVLFVPASITSEMLVTLDSHHVHIWRGGSRVRKVRTDVEHKVETKSRDTRQPGNGGQSQSLNGISKWVYVEKWRVYIIATSQLTLRVLDSHLDEISSVSSSKPVLCMEYINEFDHLVVGQVGRIKTWKLQRESVNNREIFTLSERTSISDLADDEWVVCLHYQTSLDLLLFSCESTLYVYKYSTGRRLDKLFNIHEMSITSIQYYEPLSYIITGGKDGKIKVWNCQKFLVYEFHEHFKAVTGLLLVESVCRATPKTVPAVMSCSLDGSIRMWNFELGTCIYRIDTQQPCLGMRMIKKDTFFHFSKSTVSIWNINRYYQTFYSMGSQPILMRRASEPSQPARIITVAADSTLKILSPVTGAALVTGFPTHKDVHTLDMVYCYQRDTAFCLTSEGEVVVYDTSVNPCKIVGIWEHYGTQERLNCIACICIDPRHTGRLVLGDGRISGFKETLFLIGGSTNGQILNINTVFGKQELICQAHTAEISTLVYDDLRFLLISGGQDALIKVWRIATPVEPLVPSTDPLPSFVLECVSVLSIEGFDSPLPVTGWDCDQAIVALGFNGSIFLYSYNETSMVTPRRTDEENTATITCIVHLASYSIWASSSINGTIRIWDQGGALLREIQFNETILSILFCNDRGDLLVGLRDQIAVVAIQEYLPLALLRDVGQRVFQDDPTEAPTAFDVNLDFWEYCYDQQRLEKDSMAWHVVKDAQAQEAAVKRKEAIAVLRGPTLAERRALGLKRRQIRLQMEREKKLLKAARQFEVNGDEQPSGQLDTEMGSSEFKFDKYLAAASLEEVNVDLIRPTSPTLSEKEALAQEEEVPDRTLIIQCATKKKERAKKLEERIKKVQAELAPPNLRMRPVATKEQAEAKAREIRKKLQHSGVALPNSTVTTVIKPKSKPDRRHEEKRAEPKEAFSAPKYAVPKNRARGKPIIKKSVLLVDDTSFREPGSAYFDVLDEVEEMNIEMPEPMQPPEDRLAPEEAVLPEAIPDLAPVEAPPPVMVDQSLPIQATVEEVTQPTTESLEPIQEPQPIEVQVSLPKISSIQRRMQRPPPTFESKRVFAPPHVPQPKVAEKKIQYKMTAPKPAPKFKPPPERVSKPIVRHTVKQPEPSGLSVESLKFEKEHYKKPKEAEPEPDMFDIPDVEYLKPEPKIVADIMPDLGESYDPGVIIPAIYTSSQESEQYCWNLIRQRDDADDEVLTKITKLFWFPGLKGKPLTLTNIIAVLLDVLRGGYWSEKCESSKAILFLYRTFKDDFLDPMGLLVKPQIECLWDDSWQVRAQITSNLVGYEIYHPEIIFALICRLDDKNDAVRKAALTSLMHFGINSRENLQKTMVSLGLMKRSGAAATGVPHLRKLHDELNTQHRQKYSQKLSLIRDWLHRANESPERRPGLFRDSSYYDHLAGPFFPADAPGFEMPPPTVDVLFAHHRNNALRMRVQDWDVDSSLENEELDMVPAVGITVSATTHRNRFRPDDLSDTWSFGRGAAAAADSISNGYSHGWDFDSPNGSEYTGGEVSVKDYTRKSGRSHDPSSHRRSQDLLFGSKTSLGSRYLSQSNLGSQNHLLVRDAHGSAKKSTGNLLGDVRPMTAALASFGKPLALSASMARRQSKSAQPSRASSLAQLHQTNSNGSSNSNSSSNRQIDPRSVGSQISMSPLGAAQSASIGSSQRLKAPEHGSLYLLPRNGTMRNNWMGSQRMGSKDQLKGPNGMVTGHKPTTGTNLPPLP
ncbi:uncharacterized protein BJ171DRAFT_605914 [Polychytrium aggregatum]|uniref:uncharacterized protein n=1 Tax=Polychytrium aggregatum TaxID=110093 RepID=UPI0022FEBAEA|nr:uncharacterized protein BJ171DRAFT_605914 [Polychytrium aggregatum]KAI9190859.1 hypothetical protein BJ171DRAFT_605914 [Polychytrium aggregatum]